jgi:hypothetical protein
MRENGRYDHGPDLQPGQIWLIEHPAASGLSMLDQSALARADVVLYARGLASVIADLLPALSYAEPLAAEVEEDTPAISSRAVKLAYDGWRVVQLIEPSRGWRRRLRGAAEEPRWPGSAGSVTVRLIAKTVQPPCSRERHLQELPELVDGSAKDDLLTLIVGPLAARASAADYGFAANGLAG